MDFDYLQFTSCIHKVAQDQTSVQAIITENKQYNSHFLNIFGNTIPIKDKLKTLGFKYFKGVWGMNVKYITDNIRSALQGMGINLQALDDLQAQLAQPQSPATETPAITPTTSEVPSETPASPAEVKKPEDAAIDQKMDEMQFGIDLAMKKTGTERISSLMTFVDRMIENIAQMTDTASQSQMIKDFMSLAAKFHQYSMHNQILIWVQNRNASYVNGHAKWMQMGRQVVNWDKGITILAPRFRKQEVQTDQGTSEENRLVGFGTVKVYDIADTEPIPGFEQQTGKKPFEKIEWRKDSNEQLEEIEALVNALNEWAKSNKIEITSEKMDQEMGGYSAGGKIAINDTFKGINMFSTYVHECAHEILHWNTIETKQRDEASSRQEKEIDAETVAYIVLQHYGFETVDTPNYLALWKVKGEDIRRRRDNINKAVKIIIKGIDQFVGENVKAGLQNFDEQVAEPTPPTVASAKKQIKISKTQWQLIGKKTGWLKP